MSCELLSAIHSHLMLSQYVQYICVFMYLYIHLFRCSFEFSACYDGYLELGFFQK